jgi:hypothetical protein
LLFLLSGPVMAAPSAWDETQLELLRLYSTPLRWYNVDGFPYWVGGPKLRHQFRGQPSLIALQPAEECTLRAAANTWLRLAGKTRTLNPEDLQVSISVDARTFTAVTSFKTVDPYSLLIALPQDEPVLVRLARPAQSDSEAVFAAYFSVEQPFKTLAPYRNGISLPGKPLRLRRDDEAVSEPAWFIQPDEGSEFWIKGPVRLRFMARLPWPVNHPLREQALVMQLQLDHWQPFPLLLSPELDARHRTRVNHTTELVSERMNGFVNVPDGRHRVRVDPSVPIYLSVFEQPQPDFLCPWLNGPSNSALNVLRSSLNADGDEPPVSFGPSALPLSVRSLVSQEQAAWRLAFDNRPLDAAGQAADWLNRVAQSRRDYPQARKTAATLWHQRTFCREVLPARLSADQSLRQRFFSSPRILELFEPQRPIGVQNPTVEQIRQLLEEGHFVTVPHVLSPGLVYQLPRRSYDSRLRIAAIPARQERTALFVQFDQEPPVKVSVDSRTALPDGALEPSAAFATLHVLGQEANQPARGTFGERVGEFDLPLPIANAALAELPLPRRVQSVRLYQESPAIPFVASVAYRAAKPFEAGELSYRSLLNQTTPEATWRKLFNVADGTEKEAETENQLSNFLLPMARLLRAHFSDFTNSVSLAYLSPAADHPLSAETASELKKKAEALEQQSQPIDALEIRNRLFWEGTESQRLEAALPIMRDLQRLDEDFLAMQYARYILLRAPTNQIPAEAVTLLESYARQVENFQQLEQVRAFLFLRCPCAEHLAGLVEGFALNSQEQFVVSGGLLLPREKRPLELMLSAALHLNWWSTFDRLVEDLPDSETRALWRAQKHLALYHFDEAERELEHAGQRGTEMLSSLLEGMDIRRRLASPHLVERLEAVFAWEQWQAHQPGPRTWRTAEGVVYESAGGEQLFNCEQNEFISFFRAERGKPVKLRFLGPVRLQVEVRPVIDIPFEKPVDDWIEIAEYGLTNRVPVCQCLPYPSLSFASGRSAVVGSKTIANLDWGPGLHEVEVGLAGRTGLVRVLLEEPTMPLRILPVLNVERLNRVLDSVGKPVANTKHVSPDGEVWWVPPELAAWGPEAPSTGSEDARRLVQTAACAAAPLTDVQRLRLALRSPSESTETPTIEAQDLQALPVAEQWLAGSRWQHWDIFTNWQELWQNQKANYLLATGRIRQLLDEEIPRDILPRLITLLQVAEGFPEYRQEAQCLAELLASQTNCPMGCTKLMVRMTQNLAWQPLPVSPLSTGVRPLQVSSDFPQDPSVRIRRALLPPAGTNQFTISGQNEFAATMTLQHPAEVQVRFELTQAGFSPLAALKVALQVDGLDIRHFPLVPLKPTAGTNFTLKEGPHLVRVWIEDPVVNQFVRVTLEGQAGGVTNSIWSQSMAQAGSGNRFFHGATASQPLRFSWTGPALLRIDEWREGQFLSQLRLVPRGEQRIEIPPAPGRTESWYRIFIRTSQTNQPDVRPAFAFREPEEVPPPKLALPEPVPPSRAQLTDYYPLGGQEGGTWSFAALAAHRWPFEPGGRKNASVNEFVEADAAYLKQNARETLWSTTEALARVHRPGDLTFGAIQRIEERPQDALFEWSWLGKAYVGSLGPQQHDTEAALHTALEVGQHRHLSRTVDFYPFATLFARYLSLDAKTASTYKYIDQDIFTQFRSTHRWGGIAGSQLEYAPWLDTVLKGYIDVASNEDFSPDQWGMRFYWNQLFGPLRTEIGYECRQFLQDRERSSSSWIQGVVGGVYAEHWLNGRHRLEIGGQYRHDWPGTGSSYFAVLRWDFSNGRGYKDYGPREMEFRDLRSRHIPSDFNNQFQPGPSGASLP